MDYVPPKLETRTRQLTSDFELHYAITERKKPASLLVFMPSALDALRPDRGRPHFARWSWANHFPKTTVISIADPALAASPSLDAAWYIHHEYDFVALIAEFISEYAQSNSIPFEKILFYGTSLGGFGALACASLIPGSRASAEVPQIDVGNWLSDKAQQQESIECHLLQGRTLNELRTDFPERLNLKHRFLAAGRVPDFLIHSNPGDQSYIDHKELIEWIALSDLPNGGASCTSQRGSAGIPITRARKDSNS